MSMSDYEAAVELINESGDGDFEGEKPEELIVAAENALAVRFPPTYRRFLSEFGCGDIGGEEFYGLIDSNFESSTVPNGIWLTLNERTNIGLPMEFVIIYATGDGNYMALDTSQETTAGESSVVALSSVGEKLQTVSPSFGSFLLNFVKNVV